MAEPAPGLVTRLGALLIAPCALARRDLDANDGQAGDDLVLLALVALALGGAAKIGRAVLAMGAGRHSGALGALAQVFSPSIVLVGTWIGASLLLKIFTWRLPGRALGELASRVTTGVVLGSLAVAPLAGGLSPGAPRTALEALPWAWAALLFSLVLREALDPAAPSTVVGAPLAADRMSWIAPAQAKMTGRAFVVVLALAGGVLAVRGWARAETEGAYQARLGAPAPEIDQPRLGEPGRLLLAALRGRPVVLSFWATWCGPCLAELPALERVYRARGPEAPLVFLVNVDEPQPGREAAVRAVVERLTLSMPVVLDDGAAARAYAISSIPSSARVGADGTLEQMVERPLSEGALREFLR